MYSPMDISFRLASGRAFVPIAETADEGVYAALTEPRCGEHAIFFVSSEAQGGFIALDFRAALELIVALPYWFDCLKISGGGSLREMERACTFLERELQEDFEDVEGRRARLRHDLGIGVPFNPLCALHEAVMLGATGESSTSPKVGILHPCSIRSPSRIENSPSLPWRSRKLCSSSASRRVFTRSLSRTVMGHERCSRSRPPNVS